MWIELRNGKRKDVRPAQAKALVRARIAVEVEGDYKTRDMADQPKVIKQPEEPIYDDGLDMLEKAELHALAKERGLTLHHMLGADKVRAALREQT